MSRSLAALLVGALMLGLFGCDSGSDTETQPPPPTPTPTPDPHFTSCMATTPVDSGDPNKPVITLIGPAVISLPAGTPYTDAGAAATDPREGDLTSRMTVSGLAGLNTSLAGDYLIRYNVVNTAQLAAVEVARLVRVHGDSYAAQTARDFGTAGAHMAYYEHLPVTYSDNAADRFPLIVSQHGWGGARFDDYGVEKTPLNGLTEGDMVKLINGGPWDDSRPFIVLSPQRCVDPADNDTALRTKIFIDYAINTYKVDPTRIYLMGYSAGSCLTWAYVAHYPHQLAAVVPMSGSYTEAPTCSLSDTPAWAFQAADDQVGSYLYQVQTVDMFNNCHPRERAKITIFPNGGHSVVEEFMTIALTGLGQGIAPYDVYDQSIYDWLLQHNRPQPSTAAVVSPAARAHAPSGVPSGMTFAVAPAMIRIGRTATLRWSAPGAVSCAASGEWLGSRPAQGAEAIKPLTPGTYGYVLTCGSAAQSVLLTVRP